jgi:hypothetical protein
LLEAALLLAGNRFGAMTEGAMALMRNLSVKQLEELLDFKDRDVLFAWP